MKISIIVPVYYNEESLIPLYNSIKNNCFSAFESINAEYEIIMVDDGSGDNSFKIMQELRAVDMNIKIYRLSRNFGSHAAIMCGLEHCTGDCAVVKAADMQEPAVIILQMVDKWREGSKVVLAVREGREDKGLGSLFAKIYYSMMRKYILHNMPSNGFDVFLIDRKVIDVLKMLDERNSILTGLVLWGGFRTDYVYYIRLARELGKSRWSLKKKILMVEDSIFSFSLFPIRLVTCVGCISFISSIVWSVIVFLFKIQGKITVDGWTMLYIFQLASFGITMLSIGIIGQYIWRTYDDTRKRPRYIIEKKDDLS